MWVQVNILSTIKFRVRAIEVFRLSSYGVTAEFRVRGGGASEVVEGFGGSFPKRYLPTFDLTPLTSALIPTPRGPQAIIHWDLSDEGIPFRVRRFVLREGAGEADEYWVESPPPAPYVNESPYFFVLQALSRLYVRDGKLLFTDTVTVLRDDGEAVMLLGYPHTGKSTLLAMTLAEGGVPLTTENTLVEVRGSEAWVVGGTGVLVYDPKVERVYGIKLPEGEETTRHGYVILDLDKVTSSVRAEALAKGVKVAGIYVLHCSFVSRGAEAKAVKGRKVAKTLWHFATAIIRGTDYYEPYPPSLTTPSIDKFMAGAMRKLSKGYSGRMWEVFGSHEEVLKLILHQRG